MARKSQPPSITTLIDGASKQQLADLVALLGLMQSASRLSQELDALANKVGGSVEKMAERFGVPFFEVHQTYVEEQSKPKPRRASKAAAQR